MSKSILAIVFVSILSFSAQAVSAQCVDLPTEQDNLQGKAKPLEAETEGMRYKVPLPVDTRFVIALENEMSSANTKENDLILFTVASDVYAYYPNKDAPVKRCLVIPKDTKVYGLVDYARPRYPFYIGGKAKLYVYLQSMQLATGETISLDFSEPKREFAAVTTLADGKDNRKNSLKSCKKNQNRQCIAGRRAKLTFSPTIIAAGAGTAATLVKDDTAKAVALLGLIQSLGNLSSVDGLVNPPEAILKSKTYYEVKTGKAEDIWVTIKR